MEHLEATLFGLAPAANMPAPVGPFAGVALEHGIDRVLDYSIPPRLLNDLLVGQRVRVPLGKKNKSVTGYVVSIHPTTERGKIKPLIGIEDPRVLLSASMLELSRWMSRYYVAPLGQALESVIPAAVKKRIGVGYSNIVRLIRDRAEIAEMIDKIKAPRRRAILARLLLLEPEETIELLKLASEAGAAISTVRKLAALGIISIRQEADLAGWAPPEADRTLSEIDLVFNPDQQAAFDSIAAKIQAGGFSVNLLHGVTGSGKTEIYLQAIRRTLLKNQQAIVMVPEIALTPQTVRRFEARFQRVAVLHSGLTASQRHRFWQQISSGHADVIVGARSAVFAPAPNVGLIVVDEEHDASYKQDTAPRYHARDVAIKRAQLQNIPVILGSATPSLETFHRARNGIGSYSLLTLPSRVRGLSLPHIECVDMRQEARLRPGIHLIGRRLEHLLRATVDAKKQAILLLNRRGYSNFVYCPSCTHLVQCKYCDTTMTYHRRADSHAAGGTFEEGKKTGQLHCHYCLAVNPLPTACPECGKKLSLFGLGTQRVEEELARRFPDITFARVDSDTMRSGKDYEALLDKFGRGEIQVLLGTQMIAKGLDYPNVILVGVINGDTALSLPDFRASERTFQLITQVAGRAGRGDSAGRVVLQTFSPDDPTIRAAIAQDYPRFAESELAQRREVGLPPFSRMARIIIRDEDQEKLHQRCTALAAEMTAAIAACGNLVRMRGPMPCPIGRIAGYHRHQIVLYCERPGPLQKVLALSRKKGQLAHSDRVAVDVDPVSLL